MDNWDGVVMSEYKPNTEIEDEELLITMKKRILASYKWHKDVVVPFAKLNWKYPPRNWKKS